MSVSSTKKSGWITNKFVWVQKIKKDRSDLIEMIIMDSGTTINLIGNKSMIINRKKSETPMNFMTNLGSKIVN